MLDININDRKVLLELIEEGELIKETPSKYHIRSEVLIKRDGRLYMVEYERCRNDGVQEDTAVLYEVVARQVITTVYHPIL
jgi:hypothetical protein